MVLDVYAQDDARYSSGTNAPMKNPPPVVTLVVSKYRGPGLVTINEKRPVVKPSKGGRPFEAFEGRATTTVTFWSPGEYLVPRDSQRLLGSRWCGSRLLLDDRGHEGVGQRQRRRANRPVDRDSVRLQARGEGVIAGTRARSRGRSPTV